MRILYSVHLYPPYHNCGAEYFIHHINKYFITKGHQIRIILHQAKMHKVNVPYNYDGIEVMGSPTHCDAYMWADVIVSHLDFTKYTLSMADIVGKPFIHIVHNPTPYESILSARHVTGVIYNSNWLKDELAYNWPSYVFQPPCPYDYYNVCRNPVENEYITLISINENKGGYILKRLAEAMPERKFLAVKGSYDPQITEQPSNVTILPNSPDIKQVYAKTRVLLMLSRDESWGMTATEAMCNGIPVVSTPTKGLKENLSDAGLYIDKRGPIQRDKASGGIIYCDQYDYDLTSVIKQIKKLDKPNFYQAVSAKCRERARELDPGNRLPGLENFFYECIRNYKRKQSVSGHAYV